MPRPNAALNTTDLNTVEEALQSASKQRGEYQLALRRTQARLAEARREQRKQPSSSSIKDRIKQLRATIKRLRSDVGQAHLRLEKLADQKRSIKEILAQTATAVTPVESGAAASTAELAFESKTSNETHATKMPYDYTLDAERIIARLRAYTKPGLSCAFGLYRNHIPAVKNLLATIEDIHNPGQQLNLAREHLARLNLKTDGTVHDILYELNTLLESSESSTAARAAR